MYATGVRQYLVVHGLHLLFSSPVPEHHVLLREDYGLFFVDAEPGPEALTFEVVFDDADSTSDCDPAAVSFQGTLGDVITVDPKSGVRVAGKRIADSKAYQSEVRAYFTALVLRELTRQRTANLFHASAVAGARGAVVFAGAKKMGKSSLAMLCSLAGAKYVSNDMTLLALGGLAGDAPVLALGLPQPITLAPGAVDWFARRRPAVGLETGRLEDGLDHASRFTLETGEKSRIKRSVLAEHTSIAADSVPLGTLIFPEPNLELAKPRARRLDRNEAALRLSMLAETFLKWNWPVTVSAEDYLERVGSIILKAVDSAPAWHIQWCHDHDLNYELIEEIGL